MIFLRAKRRDRIMLWTGNVFWLKEDISTVSVHLGLYS